MGTEIPEGSVEDVEWHMESRMQARSSLTRMGAKDANGRIVDMGTSYLIVITIRYTLLQPKLVSFATLILVGFLGLERYQHGWIESGVLLLAFPRDSDPQIWKSPTSLQLWGLVTILIKAHIAHTQLHAF